MPESANAAQIIQLEKRIERQHSWVDELDKGVVAQAVTAARHEERLDGHDDAINRLADTVNKGVWALVGFSFTIAASAVGLALTLGGHP